MNEPTSVVEPGTRDLLAAIREALDVPFPADYNDNNQALRALAGRAAIVRGALDAILEGPVKPEHAVGAVRSGTDWYPIHYVPVTIAQLGEQTGGAQ